MGPQPIVVAGPVTVTACWLASLCCRVDCTERRWFSTSYARTDVVCVHDAIASDGPLAVPPEVVELARNATPQVVLNQLYKQTPLQSSFAFNMLALVPVRRGDSVLI